MGVLDTGVIGKYGLGLSGGTDSSVNSNNLTPVNSPTTSISHDGFTVDGASVFDQTNYFTGANAAVAGQTGTLSFSTWLQTNGTDDLFVAIAITDKFYLQKTLGNYQLVVAGGGTHTIAAADTGLHHFVVSMVGTALKIWMDTVLLVDETMTGSIVASTEPLSIGTFSPALFFYLGTIDDSVFFDKELFQADSEELFVMADFDVLNTITITTPSIVNFPHQVDNLTGLGVIVAAGGYFYNGTPPAIMAKWKGGVPFIADATPSGDIFSFVLPESAGHGDLEVWFDGFPGISDTIPTGIGNIIPSKGQSNANGKVFTETIYTGTQPAFIFKTDGTEYVPLVEFCAPENVSSNLFTHYPRLANIIEADTGYPVYIVDTAWGSTGLADGSPLTPGDWSAGGKAYDRAVQIINDSGITDALCSIWFQGWNDLFTGITRSAYETQLPITLAGLRADTGLTNLKTIVNASNWGTSDVLDIRDAQIRLWDSSDPSIIAGAITSDLNLDAGSWPADPGLIDGIHLRFDNQSEVYCQRTYAMIKAEFMGGVSVRGPRVSSVTVAATNQALASWDAVGPLQDVRIDDFTALDDSGALNVIGTVIQNSTEVLVTFDRPMTTNPFLYYARFNTSEDTTFRDSQTEIPAFNPVNFGAPAEPFLSEPITAAPLTITPNTGVIEIEGFNPLITAPVVFDFNAGQIEIQGFNPEIIAPSIIAPNVGQIEITGFNPVISTPVILDLNAGQINIIGYNPSIKYSAIIRPPSSRIFIVPIS